MIRIAKSLPENTAALVYTAINRRYLTGFESSLGFLLISKDDSCLFVDGRYILAAKRAVKNCRVELFTKISDSIKDFVNINNIKTLFCEDTITVAELKRFKEMLPCVEVTANCDLRKNIEEFRVTKSEYEVECIIKAQRIAEKAFQETLNFIKVGVTEREIAAYLEYKMKCYGSQMPSFDTIVVSGVKSAMPHGVPDGKLVETGDFITFDFGAVINGYHSDMTRTIAVGFATDKMRNVYDTVLNAQLSAEKTVKAGVKSTDVDKVAREIIANAGYGKYFTHSLGHGIGLEVHEAPTVSQMSETVLKAGNIISDEPGIYIDGEFGVRIEDMLLVTEDGSKNLTNCEKSLIII